MKKIAVMACAVALLVGCGMAGAGENPPPDKNPQGQAIKKQTICPIEGGKVNRNLFVDFDGKRVYFCCEGCPGIFRKDPAKYIAKMGKEGITLDKTPAVKPATLPHTDAK